MVGEGGGVSTDIYTPCRVSGSLRNIMTVVCKLLPFGKSTKFSWFVQRKISEKFPVLKGFSTLQTEGFPTILFWGVSIQTI